MANSEKIMGKIAENSQLGWCYLKVYEAENINHLISLNGYLHTHVHPNTHSCNDNNNNNENVMFGIERRRKNAQ